MKMTSRDLGFGLIAVVALLALLVVGRPLLVPLVFTLLIWAVLNAAAEVLLRWALPRWFAWFGTLTLLVGAIYLVIVVVGSDAAAFATQAPGYVSSLAQFISEKLAPLRLGIDVQDIFSRSDLAAFLTGMATSLGTSVFAVVQVLIYVGFLLAEQNNISDKFARLQASGHIDGQHVLETIARQVQSYLGLCTILSTIMAAASFALLALLNVQFAALWALLIFILTYIPTIGAIGVVIPALMALVQFGTLGAPLVIIVVLGAIHFLLMNVAATLILGQSLNLSPFVILIALTFWGLVWGIAGLFLAVPVTAALAIVCSHIDGLRWISVLLAAPEPRRIRKEVSVAP